MFSYHNVNNTVHYCARHSLDIIYLLLHNNVTTKSDVKHCTFSVDPMVSVGLNSGVSLARASVLKSTGCIQGAGSGCCLVSQNTCFQTLVS